jgi:hypothetical protein
MNCSNLSQNKRIAEKGAKVIDAVNRKERREGIGERQSDQSCIVS